MASSDEESVIGISDLSVEWSSSGESLPDLEKETPNNVLVSNDYSESGHSPNRKMSKIEESGREKSNEVNNNSHKKSETSQKDLPVSSDRDKSEIHQLNTYQISDQVQKISDFTVTDNYCKEGFSIFDSNFLQMNNIIVKNWSFDYKLPSTSTTISQCDVCQLSKAVFIAVNQFKKRTMTCFKCFTESFLPSFSTEIDYNLDCKENKQMIRYSVPKEELKKIDMNENPIEIKENMNCDEMNELIKESEYKYYSSDQEISVFSLENINPEQYPFGIPGFDYRSILNNE